MRSVAPIRVARFLKERERHELEITAKQSELPTLFPPYTANIDRSLLKNLVFKGKFEKIAPNTLSASDLTDENIKS